MSFAVDLVSRMSGFSWFSFARATLEQNSRHSYLRPCFNRASTTHPQLTTVASMNLLPLHTFYGLHPESFRHNRLQVHWMPFINKWQSSGRFTTSFDATFKKKPEANWAIFFSVASWTIHNVNNANKQTGWWLLFCSAGFLTDDSYFVDAIHSFYPSKTAGVR